jgi:hypothetical protein
MQVDWIYTSAPVATRRKRSPAIALALLVGALLVLAACGNDKLRSSGEEGDFIKAGPAVYQVQLSRLLNPHIRPDDDLLRGQVPPPPTEQYLAVFVRIENKGDADYKPPRDLKVVDTQGNEYLPLDATQSSFGLDFGEPIPAGDDAPPPNSPAEEGPTRGAMILYRVKNESATSNLPLELEIPTGPKSSSSIELDI